jgi:hypothetical protein
MLLIGTHRITNESVEHPAIDAMLDTLGGRKIDCLYSDPPWGDGNMRYWVTMNKKMTGAVHPALTYEALVARLFSFVHRHVDGHVFVETGTRWGEMLGDRFLAEGMHKVQSIKLRYRSGSALLENDLILGCTHPGAAFDASGLEAINGAALSQEVLKRIRAPGGVVFDPCCGMGYTARAAVHNGMTFLGNDFNAKRLAKTISFLQSKV